MITKINYDKSYPYLLENAWGEKVSLDKEDLIQLKKEITKILKEDVDK